jgi:HSP20 family protein
MTMSAVKESTQAPPKAHAPNGSKGQQSGIAQREAAPPASQAMGHPLAAMRRFAEEADRFFEEFGLGWGFRFPNLLTRGHELLRRETGLIPAQWSPRVEVVEREGKLIVRADLPGMSKDDVKVEATDDMLTIQGERRQTRKEEREGYLYNECSYGHFYRAIPLPEGIDATKAAAEFKNGVLEVVMPAPHKQEKKSRRVEIQEGR